MKMKAYRLSQIDKQYDMHLQAWLNHAVTATKEQGKKQVPVYSKFEDFFDYKKRLQEIETPTKSLTPKMRKLALKAAEINAGKEM